MAVRNDVWLRIPSDTFYLGLIRKIVADLARHTGFSQSEVEKIEMAVDEACTKVIQGSAMRKDVRATDMEKGGQENIEITVTVCKDMIAIELIDNRGILTDLDATEEEKLDQFLAEMDLGKLGNYVIKVLMDEVRYSTTPEGGGELRMTKRLANKPAA